MTLGAISVASHIGKQPSAPSIELILDVVGDDSYPTGGTSFDADALLRTHGNYDQAQSAAFVQVEPITDFNGKYDRANKKLIVLQDDGTEITNTTDLSGQTFRVKITAK